MDETEFLRLVDLYDRFANALDFDSPGAEAAEGEFYLLLEAMFQIEKRAAPGLEYTAFRHGVVLRCKQRINKGN